MLTSPVRLLLPLLLVLAVHTVGCGDSQQSTEPGESREVRLPEQPYSTHVELGESHPTYNSIPATSGWHSGFTAKWGVHDTLIPDEVLVHNLEHGGVGIHYDCPAGCPALVQSLEGISGRYGKVVMSPYPDMGITIALTAWTFSDRFDEFDEVRITDFIEAHMSSPVAPEYSVDAPKP